MNNGINKTLNKLFQAVVPAKFEWEKLTNMLQGFGAKVKIDHSHKHAWIVLKNGGRATFPVGHHHFLEGRGQVVKFRKFLDKNGIKPKLA